MTAGTQEKKHTDESWTDKGVKPAEGGMASARRGFRRANFDSALGRTVISDLLRPRGGTDFQTSSGGNGQIY